jgi:hypothetical protein
MELINNVSNLNIGDDLEKHVRYGDKYIPNDYYWGLGIENETYFMFDNIKQFTGKKIKESKHERYSVDYYKSYKTTEIKKQMNDMFNDFKLYDMPIYFNCHTLTRTDVNNFHKTTYEKEPKPNPNFSGKTIFEILCEENPKIFIDEHEKSFTFDGDTIEFMTQNFYKSNVTNVLDELLESKYNFVSELNNIFKKKDIHQKYGLIKFPDINYGLVTFMTNFEHTSIFNNGTYHINLTIPTQLNENGFVKDKDRFIVEHRKAIKMLQLFTPLITGCYGAPDIYGINNDRFSKGSLRLTSSRYVGLGSYDTDSMKCGKIVTDNVKDISNIGEKWWFNRLYDDTDYVKLDKMGFDFNFNKYKNHGIEFRIFDYFPHEYLETMVNLIILLVDLALDSDEIEKPCMDEKWNDLVHKMLLHGSQIVLSDDDLELYANLFGTKLVSKDITNLLQEISDTLHDKYNNKGICSKNMSPNMKKPKIINFNKIQFDKNKELYYHN